MALENFNTLADLMNSIRGKHSISEKPERVCADIAPDRDFRGRKIVFTLSRRQRGTGSPELKFTGSSIGISGQNGQLPEYLVLETKVQCIKSRQVEISKKR